MVFMVRKNHWKGVASELAMSLEGIIEQDMIDDILSKRRKQLADPIKLGARIEQHVWHEFHGNVRKYVNRIISRRFALMRNPELR